MRPSLHGLLRWVPRLYTLLIIGQWLSLFRNLDPTAFPRLEPIARRSERSDDALRLSSHASTSLSKHQAPSASIVLPARNEEDNIIPCVQSLLHQYANGIPVELIVVNDASTDATGALLDSQFADGRLLTVLHLGEKPDGWAGKPHALHAGASRARGEWLLFTDADTRWEPGAVEALVRCAESSGADLVTALPTVILPTLLERVVVPTLLTTLLAATQPVDIRHPRRRWAAGANGQCLLVRRAAYEAIGGFAHPELRNALLDDSTLARVIKRAGYRLQAARGESLLRVRMYPTLTDAWQGWGRSLGASFQLYPRSIGMILLAVLSLTLLLPYAFTIRSLLEWRRHGHPPELLIEGLGALVPTLSTFGSALSTLGLPFWYVVLHPMGIMCEFVLLVQAWLKRIRGIPVTWKGRGYVAADTARFHDVTQ